MKKVIILKIMLFLLCFSSSFSQAQSQGTQKQESVLSTIVESVVGAKKDNNKSPNANSLEDANQDKDFSLMYSPNQQKRIREAFDAFKNKVPLVSDGEVVKPVEVTVDNAKSYVYLGSIIYRSKNDWAVWINDQKISADDNKSTNEIYIKKINDEKAEISWTMSISKWKILTGNTSEEAAPINANNQVEFNFILSFNQTYVLNLDKVVEGRISSIAEVNENQVQ